jgi:riboflavin kinase/FMN adenylyltransferase
MQIFSSIDDFPDLGRDTVAAIGNFDGIHLGHRHILRILVDEAQKKDMISLVLTFSPHPDIYFGKKPVRMIQTMDQRLQEIKKNNISVVLILPFNQSIAGLSSRDFIKNILIDTVRARTIVVGENFRFGKNREGNSRVIKELSPVFNFKFLSIPAQKKNGQVISSSWIRTHLLRGDVEKANRLLGRPYEITGTVIKGQSRGKIIGFPTANILSPNEIFPEGVFLTEVNFGGNRRPALTNIGRCPTFKQKETNVESHIIDFSGDLYSQTLSIQFYKKLRDERIFGTAEQLSAQIAKDLIAAKEFFLKK